MKRYMKDQFIKIGKFFFTILIIYFLVMISIDIYQIKSQHKKLNKLQDTVTQLETKNQEVEEYNKKLENDPVELEKLARKLGMKKDGEKVYRFWKSDEEIDINTK